MRRNLKTVIAASALVGGLLAAPALYAHAPGGSQGGMMGPGMMGQGGMMHGGEGDMMAMMERMNGMMAACMEMMQAHMEHHGPDGQRMTPQHERAPSLREEQPPAPEKRG